MSVDAEGPFVAFDPAWIAHRDDDLIVIDKPAGMASQAADAAQPDDLVTRLRDHLAAERGVAAEAVYLGVLQRLDRETSGLLLYTLRPEVNAAVAAQFEARSVDKRYEAIVAPWDGGGAVTLRDHIARGRDGRMEVVDAGGGRQPGRGKRASKAGTGGKAAGKEAVTEVEPTAREGTRALVSLRLLTGRTHQLRLQLAHRGAPIVGDPVYGSTAAPRMWLHAASLSLQHPAGGPLSLQAPRPAGMDAALSVGSVEAAPLSLEGFDVALARALQTRHALYHARHGPAPTTAFRLLHGAADGTPGLAVDVYDRHLLLHVMSAEAEGLQEALLDRLHALGFDGVYLKRHPRQKNELGLDAQEALCPPEPLRGAPAPEELVVHEHGVPYGVRLGDGLRTGIFLDQRDNRRRLAERAVGGSVLNLFAYTGGFSIAALQAGAAEACCVDTSRAVLSRAKDNAARIDASARHSTMAEDAFEALARFARKGRRFDHIVLDPPSYSTGRKRRLRVVRDYPELVERCLRVLAPGGTLLACINHHGVSQVQLRAMVRRGAEAAGVAPASLRDVPAQRDFPAEPGKQPLAKQVLLGRARS